MDILRLYLPDKTGLHKSQPPKEDAWALERKRGIFVVADGVHLYKNIEYKGKYPNPSPAGRLAKKFCDVFVKYAKKNNLRTTFKNANRAVWIFNKNRDKATAIENTRVYYAATAAFAKLKDNLLEYGHICDASVSAISKKGKLLFWENNCGFNPDFPNWFTKGYSEFATALFNRTIFRNLTLPRGKKLGYGVITGEEAVETYAVFKKIKLRRGVVYVLATDGFTPYLKRQDFRKKLTTFDRKELKKFINGLSQKNKNPNLKLEKTLIAFKIN